MVGTGQGGLTYKMQFKDMFSSFESLFLAQVNVFTEKLAQ